MQSRYLHIYVFYRLTFVARPSWVQCIQVCSIRSSQWSSALLIQTVKIIVPFKIFLYIIYNHGLYCLEQMKMEECWGKWQRRRDYLGRNFSNAWHPARFSTNPRATTNLSASTEQLLAGNLQHKNNQKHENDSIRLKCQRLVNTILDTPEYCNISQSIMCGSVPTYHNLSRESPQ